MSLFGIRKVAGLRTFKFVLRILWCV